MTEFSKSEFNSWPFIGRARTFSGIRANPIVSDFRRASVKLKDMSYPARFRNESCLQAD